MTRPSIAAFLIVALSLASTGEIFGQSRPSAAQRVGGEARTSPPADLFQADDLRTAKAVRDSAVKPASSADPEIDNLMMPPEAIPGDYAPEDGSVCDSCPGPCDHMRPCRRPGGWLSGEYLLWSFRGMDTPPLVTGSSNGSLPDLADPNTMILFGGEDILESSQSGFRIRFGKWLDACDQFGIGAEYFQLDGLSESRAFSSDENGNPILGRPFFNMNPRNAAGELIPPLQDVQLVSDPGALAGTATVSAFTELQSTAVFLRYRLFCRELCVRSLVSPCCPAQWTSRLDLMLGYRHMRLNEGLTITEDLNTLNPPSPINSINELITDDFQTRNEFHGSDLAVLWELQRNQWTLEFLGRIGLGNTEQNVGINGSTIRTINGVPQSFTGGLLAQTTNIGQYEHDEFSVVPEFGITGGLWLTPRLRVTAGYTFLYWTRVARPGDQIDLDVNPDYLPPAADPLTGPSRPQFAFRQTDFWAQGLSLGAELRW